MKNQKGFTIVDFLIQLIFVVLFVIVLVWLFPTKDYLKNSLNSESIFYEKDTDISDSTFINNINNMMEASKSYFGHNVALPKEIDEEVTVTLQKLVDEHVLIMPKDKKGKTCSGDSTATITKTTFGYSIKVSLTCGEQTDYIIRNVGCDPFCDKDCNTSCKLEYEYVKKTEAHWTDWSKFTEWSTNKVTASDTMKVETKVVDNKTCPSGYKLNAAKTACTKTVTTQTVIKPNQVLSCPAGYTLKGEQCTKTVTTTENQKPIEVLKCPLGYTLNSEKTHCIKSTSSTNTVAAQKTTTCPSGYTLENDKCYKTTTISATNNVTYSCPSGYTLSGKTCSSISTINSTKKTSYGCNEGYAYISSNKTCMQVNPVTSNTIDKINTSAKTNCSITYELDCTNTCKVVQKETCIVDANKWNSYSCPEGYSLSSNKLTCTKTVTTAATEKSNFTCPSGYTLNNNKCTKEDVTNATTAYTCNSGTLNGDKCVVTTSSTDVVEVTKLYNCSNGELVNDTCVINKTHEDVITATKTNTCSTGTLSNNTCVVNNNKVETTSYTVTKVTYYRYSTKKYVEGSTTYKWSSSREDKKLLNSGYALTGKTRNNCS